jgi:hypothetical protein
MTDNATELLWYFSGIGLLVIMLISAMMACYPGGDQENLPNSSDEL